MKRAKVLRADCLCAVEGKITGVFDACYAEFGFLIKAGLICKKHFFFQEQNQQQQKVCDSNLNSSGETLTKCHPFWLKSFIGGIK